MDVESSYPNSSNQFTAYIVSCVKAFIENNTVIIRTKQGQKEFITNIRWDKGEMVYRFVGELSKRNKCNPAHKEICRDVMLLHLQNTVGMVLCDNGPQSACPFMTCIDEINTMDNLF